MAKVADWHDAKSANLAALYGGLHQYRRPACKELVFDACSMGMSILRCLQGDAEDAAGMRGIHLQRNVVGVAQKALAANLRLLGPLVLPLPELVIPLCLL